MESIAYYDGKIGAPEELMVPFNDRVHFFGDGCYDATVGANGKVYLLQDHLDRFFTSAKALDINIPMSKTDLGRLLTDLLAKVDSKVNFVYWQVTRGVEPRRVIYSELLPDGTSRIHDSSQLYSLFDLITAMDEFFSTGTAQKLKGYLWSEGESDPALHTLLARINQFSDDLALCRVQALNEDLSQIAQALQAPPKESKNLTSLFFHLLNDRFRTEFEGLLASPKNNLPVLVSWCAEHGMYQQALTLLCEQMPAYVCRHLFVQPTETGWAYLAEQNQNKGKAWVYPLFHFHFCRLTLMQKEYPYTTDLRLTHSKDDADGNMLFGVANSKEMHAYMDTILASGQLVIDPEVRWQIEDAALFYQRVMQYRNQINHASDTAFGLQSDRILPLDTAHIEQTLQDVADYLQEIRPMKPDVPEGVKALPVTKTIPAGAVPNL